MAGERQDKKILNEPDALADSTVKIDLNDLSGCASHATRTERSGTPLTVDPAMPVNSSIHRA